MLISICTIVFIVVALGAINQEDVSTHTHTHTHTHTQSVIKTQRNKTIQGGEIKKIFREEEKFKLELKILH